MVIDRGENNVLNQLVQDREIKEEHRDASRNSSRCEFRTKIVLNAGRLKVMVHAGEKGKNVLKMMS